MAETFAQSQKRFARQTLERLHAEPRYPFAPYVAGRVITLNLVRFYLKSAARAARVASPVGEG